MNDSDNNDLGHSRGHITVDLTTAASDPWSGPRRHAGGIKTYRRHHCGRTHRSYRTLARCIWPRAVWVAGDGPYALLSWCDVLTVSLWPTRASALCGDGGRPGRSFIDDTGCGHACLGGRAHEVIRLVPPADALPGAPLARRRPRW